MSVHSLSRVRLFVILWTAVHQAFLSITNSQSLLKIMSIELVMPSNHLILHCPLLLLPTVFPSLRDFSSESVLRITWPKYWSFSFIISPSTEYLGLIFCRLIGLISFQSKGLSKVFSNTTVEKHQFFSVHLKLILLIVIKGPCETKNKMQVSKTGHYIWTMYCNNYFTQYIILLGASVVAQWQRIHLPMQEMQVWSLGQEDPLE